MCAVTHLPLPTQSTPHQDDFEVCPFALRALHTAAVKANAQRESKGWVALRVSYGMNGVLMHNADIPDLVDYLWCGV